MDHCELCKALLTDERWYLSDGRVYCATCHASSIFLPEDADSLFQDMKAILASELDISLNIPTGLALVDQNQLGEVIRKQASLELSGDRQNLLLDAEQTLGIYTRRGMRRGIYLQTGLPQALFLQVAAHELAHAWQGENCPVLRDPILREGFAEWVAFHVLGRYGYVESQDRMLARQDIYGEGLRWALKVEAGQGAQAVITACRDSG